MNNTLENKITIRSLWALSYPLMISFLSTFVMVFIDRLYLAMYTPEALNAASSFGTLSWGIIMIWGTTAMLSEVIVGRYCGANLPEKYSKPIWQMIWFSGFSIVFFIGCFSLGYLGSVHQLLKIDQIDYFKYSMLLGPLVVLNSSLSAYFIGQGRTSIVKWLSLLGNIVNIILDPLFIFGVKGWIPSMGIGGAILATGIGFLVQIIFCFRLFYKEELKWGSLWRNARFDFPLFKKCLALGIPSGIFSGLELIGWAVFYIAMEMLSFVHIYVAGSCQTVLLLCLFFGMGLEKGVAVYASQLIGNKQEERVRQLFTKSFYLITIYLGVMLALLFVFSSTLAHLFATNAPQVHYQEILSLIQSGLYIITIYTFLENLRWIISGILTAYGYTFFMLVAGTLSIVTFLLIPTHFFIYSYQRSIIDAFSVWVFYSTAASLLFYLKYKTVKTPKLYLHEESEPS